MKEYPPDVVLRKLLKVIDYLLDFVEWPRKNKIFAYYLDHAEVAFFKLLDDRLYDSSVTAGLSDKLPDHRLLEPTLYAPESHRPAVFVGSTHLPGDWDPDPSGQEQVFWAVLPSWKEEMLRFRMMVENLSRERSKLAESVKEPLPKGHTVSEPKEPNPAGAVEALLGEESEKILKIARSDESCDTIKVVILR